MTIRKESLKRAALCSLAFGAAVAASAAVTYFGNKYQDEHAPAPQNSAAHASAPKAPCP
jgi:hypothetical protein